MAARTKKQWYNKAMSRKQKHNYKARRLVALLVIAITGLSGAIIELEARNWQGFGELPLTSEPAPIEVEEGQVLATEALSELEVKGRAPRTGYARTQFGDGWLRGADGCDMRNVILRRDLTQVEVDEQCRVQSGHLKDVYTGKEIDFVRGPNASSDVQIDHVVALSNAWQTGARLLSPEERVAFSNDPLNLLAVDGGANQQKGDGDAATWLPPQRGYRCSYVARQISVKTNYSLWITPPEKAAMERVLAQCPAQLLPQE